MNDNAASNDNDSVDRITVIVQSLRDGRTGFYGTVTINGESHDALDDTCLRVLAGSLVTYDAGKALSLIIETYAKLIERNYGQEKALAWTNAIADTHNTVSAMLFPSDSGEYESAD